MSKQAPTTADGAAAASSDEKKDEEDPFAPPPMDPLLVLLRARFAFTTEYTDEKAKAQAHDDITNAVLAHNMEPYVTLIQEAVPLNIDQAKLDAMKTINANKIAEFDAAITEAERTAADAEIREVLLAKCNHYSRIGDINKAIETLELCEAKTLAPGMKLDLCFMKVRLGLAVGDNDIVSKGIEEGKKLQKEADWERKNRLRVYMGLHMALTRNFNEAAGFLVDGLSTFAATEILTMDEFVFLTCVVSLVALPRAELKKKIADSPDVNAADVADARNLITSLHLCKYDRVLGNLYTVCTLMRQNVFLASHINYFFREGRIRAFNQFLDSYRSVTLQSMSNSFKVTPQVLDQMLFTLISSGRLSCKIDRVSGNVVTQRGDKLNNQYHTILRSGDLLLHKMQKLSRLIEFE